MRFLGCKIEIATPALSVQITSDSKRLDQRGFSGSVFSNEKGDLGVEWKADEMPDDRKAEGIRIHGRNTRAKERHIQEIGAWRSTLFFASHDTVLPRIKAAVYSRGPSDPGTTRVRSALKIDGHR